MSNSPFVVYKKLSPNHSGPRVHKIDTITPHIVVGHASLRTLGDWFARPTTQASSNYGIDDDGQVGLFVDEKNRSWCSSSNTNDQRAVTIEIASDNFYPYAITNKAMDGLIRLSADICKRNGIKKLLWKADKKLIGKIDRQNITVHRWFVATACPGDYLYGKLGEVADEVNKILIPPPVKLPYLVRINTSLLNYRMGPGTNYPIRGQVRYNEVYTIVEEKLDSQNSKWGRLKSGAGWLALEYCKKM